jgi:hypothetical protein
VGWEGVERGVRYARGREITSNLMHRGVGVGEGHAPHVQHSRAARLTP